MYLKMLMNYHWYSLELSHHTHDKYNLKGDPGVGQNVQKSK